MIKGMWIFRVPFTKIVDACNALKEIQATGEWEGIVSTFDLDDNSRPLFMTSCLSFKVLRQSIIESKKCVMLEHDIGYVELYNEGKLVDRVIHTGYSALAIVSDDIETADDALRYQQQTDFNCVKGTEDEPWSLATARPLGDIDPVKTLVYSNKQLIEIYFKSLIQQLKGNKFLIVQTADDSLSFTLVDKEAHILDCLNFLPDDLDQLYDDFENPPYEKLSSEK